MLFVPCQPSLYHFDGYCFNKSRIPNGEVAIPEATCRALDKEEEVPSKIIE